MGFAQGADTASADISRRWAASWAQLEPHIDLLLTLSPEARQRWLEHFERENAEGAAHLRALLTSRDAASLASFLSGQAVPAWLAPEVRAGETIGAYELVAPIGEGGMSSVWRARRGDGRYEGDVAIKLLHRGVFDRDAQERFRREGVILARLQHPGIVPLFDAGLTSRGQPYLVLQLIEGEAIDQWCDRRQLDVHARLALFAQVLDGVAAAHAQLVIHRDLKPSNILVTPDGCVKLLDFGIARLLTDDAASDLTRDGALALTPAYAAPEQFNGGVLSLATDIYALGVVLYQLLTGTHPAGLALAASAISYLRCASEGRAPRVSERALQPIAGDALRADPAQRAARLAATPRSLQRQLRGDLDNILARATAPNAARRYRTVPEFADDLQRHLDHRPVSAHEASWSYRAAKFLRRRALVSALSGVLVLVLAGGIVATTWQAHRAELARARAERMLAHRDAANDFVDLLLAQVSRAGRPMSFNDIIETGERLANQHTADGPAHHAYVLLSLASLYDTASNTEKVKQLAERAVSLARRSGDAALTANAQCTLANALSRLGDHDDAKRMAGEAIRAADGDAEALVNCWQARVYMANSQGDGAGMLDAALHERDAFDRGRAGRPVARAALEDDLASAYRMLGRYAEAESHYAQAFKMLGDAGALDSIEASHTSNNWGNVALDCGRLKQALERYQQALRIQTTILGSDAVPAFSLINTARVLARLDRLDEAAALAEQGARQAARSGYVQAMLFAEIAQSTVARLRGRYGDAAAHLEAARHLLEPMNPTPPRMRRLLELARAQLERAEGLHESALRRLDALHEELRPREPADALAKPTPVEQEVLKERADTLSDLGRTESALADARAAVELAKALQGDAPASATTGSALLTLARLQLAHGDDAPAHANAREAARQLNEAAGAEHHDTRAAAALAAR